MRVYQDKKTGYLVVEDIQGGIRVISEQRYNEYKGEIADLTLEISALQRELKLKDAQIHNLQRENEFISDKVDSVLSQMSIIRAAHFWEGFCNGAWYRNQEWVETQGNKLLGAVKKFPAYMTEVLQEIKAHI